MASQVPVAYAQCEIPTTTSPPSKNVSVSYWVYWMACFASLATWGFAVGAAADDAWLSDLSGTSFLELGEECEGTTYDTSNLCSLYAVATAFQFAAAAVVSVVLVLVFVAAFLPAKRTASLGLAAGIILLVFAVFQLIAFSAMAAFTDTLDDLYYITYNTYSVKASDIEVEPGPSLAVAVVAFVLGTVGAIIILSLRNRATTNMDGPFRTCMMGGSTTMSAQQPVQPPAGGKVDVINEPPPPFDETV